MKITWLGGDCFRFHLGGMIGVTWPQQAVSFAASEVSSGADLVFDGNWDALAAVDFSVAQHRRQSIVEQMASESSDSGPVVMFQQIDGKMLVCGGVDETPVVLLQQNHASKVLENLRDQMPRQVGIILLVSPDRMLSAQDAQILSEAPQLSGLVLAREEVDEVEWATLVAQGFESPVQIVERGQNIEF